MEEIHGIVQREPFDGLARCLVFQACCPVKVMRTVGVFVKSAVEYGLPHVVGKYNQ